MGKNVVLVCPPFAPIETPSLALSTLKAVGVSCGAKVHVHYSNIRFAELIGAQLYGEIAAGHPSITDMAGEWVFSQLIGGDSDDEEFVGRILLARSHARSPVQKTDEARLKRFVDGLKQARAVARAFVLSEAKKIVATKPELVGLTSVFQQTAAGLALAAAVKDIDPLVKTVFGGPNYEGSMGRVIQQNFPQVDLVVNGEGEQAFKDLLRAAPGLSSPITIQRISERGRGELDLLPVPDFEEYFSAMATTTVDPKPSPHLVMETSRGCWWGERSHCTFCGLNGSSMRYRSKSGERALFEIESLVGRYGNHPIDTVDNILDFDYFKSLVPELTRKQLRLNIFYETKSNLSRKKLEQLAECGIKRIQPGIESLSDDVLKLMGKGVSAAQNLCTIKWCQEFGIQLSWNFLWGFPGEDPAEYARLASLCPLLEHLTPPDVGTQLRLDRFSPLFENRESMALREVRPYPAYSFIFPSMSEAELHDVAYYFVFEYADGRDVESYTLALSAAIASWKANHQQAVLMQVPVGAGCRLVFDTRICRRAAVIMLSPVCAQLLDACASPTSIAELVGEGDPGATDRQEALQRLVEHGLVVAFDRLYVSVVHDFSFDHMPPRSAEVLSGLLESVGTLRDHDRVIDASEMIRI